MKFSLLHKGERRPGELSGRQKFFLALPMPASSLSGVLIHNVYIKLYTDLIGLELKYVGLVYLIYNIWNFVNDPLIGILIDRKKYDPKRGKYLHLMRVSAPFMVLCLAAMLLSRPQWPQFLIFLALLVELFIYDTFSTVFQVSYNSLYYLAAPTKEERVDINVIQSYVSNVVSFFATLVPTFLMVGDSSRPLHVIVLILMGVILFNALLYYLAARNIEDKPEYYRLGTQEGGINYATLKQDVLGILRMRSFRAWAGYSLLALAPNAVYFTAFLYFMDHVVKTSGLEATIADTLPMLLVFLILPLLGRVVKHRGAKRSIFVGVLPYILGYAALFFADNWIMVTLCYIPIMAGKYLMTTAAAPLSAALIDENERLTGTRKTGLITSLLTLIAAPTLSIQQLLLLGIMERFGYNGTLLQQSAEALMGIRIGTAIVPILFALAGMIPLFFHPINLKEEQELSEFSRQRRQGNAGTDAEARP